MKCSVILLWDGNLIRMHISAALYQRYGDSSVSGNWRNRSSDGVANRFQGNCGFGSIWFRDVCVVQMMNNKWFCLESMDVSVARLLIHKLYSPSRKWQFFDRVVSLGCRKLEDAVHFTGCEWIIKHFIKIWSHNNFELTPSLPPRWFQNERI